MQKKQFEQMMLQVRLKPEVQVEEEQLVLEVAALVLQAQKRPKDEVFAWLLGALPNTMLNQLMDFSVDICSCCSHPATSAFRLLLDVLCVRLANNEVGPFGLTDENYDGLARTLHPYFAVELIRRRRCFQTLELPASPWTFDAAIRVRGLRPEQMEIAVAELKRFRVCPPFHLLSLGGETGHKVVASQESVRILR